jgi:hypothetical protein
MNKLIVLLFLCILVLTSCKTIRKYKEVSSNEYLQKVSNVRYKDVSIQKKPILLNGFYKFSKKKEDMVPGYERILVFYEDGTCARLLVYLDDKKNGRVNLTKALKLSKSLTDGSSFWGCYKIENDSLLVNLYRRDLLGLEMGRLFFKIKNERTIVCFREDDPQQVYDGVMATWESNEEFQFVEADSIPVPQNKFLKKRKWYWESESDWERYMKDSR